MDLLYLRLYRYIHLLHLYDITKTHIYIHIAHFCWSGSSQVWIDRKISREYWYPIIIQQQLGWSKADCWRNLDVSSLGNVDKLPINLCRISEPSTVARWLGFTPWGNDPIWRAHFEQLGGSTTNQVGFWSAKIDRNPPFFGGQRSGAAERGARVLATQAGKIGARGGVKTQID